MEQIDAREIWKEEKKENEKRMRARGISVIVVVACAVAAAAVWAVTEPRAAFSKDDPALDQEGDPPKGAWYSPPATVPPATRGLVNLTDFD
jgi:hypothetical protein